MASQNDTGLQIGSANFQTVISTQSVLFAIDNNGTIYEYQNEPDNWLAISQAVKQVVCNDDDLFVIPLNTTNVLLYQGSGQWLQIGSNINSLVAGGYALYGVDAMTNCICLYQGVPNAWTHIGLSNFMYATNGDYLFSLNSDKSGIFQYEQNPPMWIQVGQSADYIFVSNNALYCIATDGMSLLRYNKQKAQWFKVGQGWSRFTYHDLGLYAISSDNSTVGYFNGVPGSWQPFASNANSITATDNYIFLTTPGGVYQYEPIEENDFDEKPKDSIDNPEANDSDWVWTFKTSDSLFAGYSGTIQMTLYRDASEEILILTKTNFKRGAVYTTKLKVGTKGVLSSITLIGLNNFFNDQWKLDSATAYDPVSQLFYTFPFDQWIPSGGSPVESHPKITRTNQPPAGYATIYVWNYLGLDVAIGHASIELADGTYISWWPSKTKRLEMPLLGETTSIPANDPQTYQMDVQGEDGHAPDWQMRVGGLNHDAIRSWWQQFKITHQWTLLTQNCSTTVADALFAGGCPHYFDFKRNG